jgi:hypothetical protein
MPIGIQDSEDTRTGACVYADKTACIYRPANEGKPCFLGKRELFLEAGKRPRLAIADLEKDRTEHPVFHIDWNSNLKFMRSLLCEF